MAHVTQPLRDAPMTEQRKEELRKIIVKMDQISTLFYGLAIQTNNHPFIEFCGFMNEYIKLCQNALQQGVDFTDASEHTGVALPVRGHHAKYIGEKFGCIFGPTLRANEEAKQAFIKEVFGPFYEDSL